MRNRFLLVAALFLELGTSAYALNPSLDISQYGHNSWTISDGFCRGSVHAIAQTQDGYLWLGSEFGLVRFDGVRCVPWPQQGLEQLPNTYIRSLLAARDGNLWIGTPGGLATWKDGKVSERPGFAGQEVGALLEDRDGTIWAGTGFQTVVGRLCAIRGPHMQCYGDGQFGNAVYSLYEDSQGRLWVGAVNGLWKWKPGPPKFYPTPDRVLAITEADNGALLVLMRGGIRQLVDGKMHAYPLPDSVPLESLFRDSGGALWIAGQYGLLHVHQGRIDTFATTDGLSSDNVRAFFEDREGNIWVATDDGVDRFRDLAVVTLSAKEGFSDTNHTAAVLASRDGSIWVANLDRLNRWKQGQITIYRRSHTGSSHGPEPGTNGGLAHEITDAALADEIAGSLFEDHRGRIWASTIPRVVYFENNRFVPLSSTASCKFVHSMAEDSAGDLWIAAHEYLCDLRDGNLIHQIPWASLGTKDFAETMVADPVRGGLWLGFYKGGIKYFKDDQVRASYATIDGLTDGRVNSLRLDRDGALWAATTGGLNRLEDGHIGTLTRKNGLPCDSLDWSIEDDARSLWLNMACGLVRIPRAELDSWTADSKRTIQITVFDSSDGVKSHAFYGSTTPHVAKSLDGEIWFSTWDGLSLVDLKHLPTNKLPPPVHVEQVIADGKTYWQNLTLDASSKLRLPPRVRDLEIDYTAISLLVPKKNRFRVKLEGYDREWIDAGSRRQVFYTKLPPRNYRFRVVASNNSGVWNEAGGSLDFSIDPAYYQTNWFRAVCVVASLAFLGGLFGSRMHQLQREQRKLRETLDTIPTMAWMAEANGRNAFVNRRCVQFTGRSAEDTAGEAWQSLVHSDDLDRFVRHWSASVGSGEPFEEEARFRSLDGEYRWFLTRAVPLRDEHGHVLRWYGVMTDIEDRKRAEELQSELAHVNRVSAVGELAASISHELKQPITAAITSANAALRWLQREQPDVSRACETTKRIVKDGARAAEIIDRLRSLYKKSPPQRQLVGVNEMIDEMVTLVRPEANRHAVSIRIDVAGDVSEIMADRVQLQQVLMNLMLNGIESMNETGGVLTLKSRMENGDVRISVSDTGVGLPRENADRIFDAFFTTKPQGSGMGLAISRTIVESHGGRLWATPNDGRGATFHLALPTVSETAENPGTGIAAGRES